MVLGIISISYYLYYLLEGYGRAAEEVDKLQLFSGSKEVKINDLQKSTHDNGVFQRKNANIKLLP